MLRDAAIPVVFDGAVLGTGGLYSRHRTGVYRYVAELLRELVEQPGIDVSVVASGRGLWMDFAARHWIRSRIPELAPHHRPVRSRFAGIHRISERIASLAFLAKDRELLPEQGLVGLLKGLGILLDPSDRPCPQAGAVYHSPAHALPDWAKGFSRILTMHDILPVLHPEWFLENDSFSTILASIDRDRDWIVCVSENTRRDFLEWSAMDPQRVFTCHPGVSSDFRPVPSSPERDRRLSDLGIRGPFVLCVATLEPRKNLANLLDAWQLLRLDGHGEGVRLVLVGARGWKTDALQEALDRAGKFRDEILLTGFVPDGMLPDLYSACTVFCFPSLYEGFGSPPLEAMACGALVHCVRNSAIPEVVGEAGVWSETGSPDDLADGLRRALEIASSVSGAKERSVLQASKFSWKDCAAKQAAIYRRIVGAV